MNTYKLLSSLLLKKIYGTLPSEINSIQQDSRKCEDGTLFVCIRGFTVDGHDYYKDAIKNGSTVIVAEEKLDINLENAALIVVNDSAKALAILANEYYNYPSTKMTLFGVTGTNGKTTVTSLMNAMLRKDNQKTALSGTIGFDIDNELVVSDNTTCDSLTNQKLLNQVSNQGVDHVIMEVSSHGLSQGRLWGVDFDVVTFTNLTHDHMDYHASMEEYAYVKGLLFAQLGNNLREPKYAVLNRDDPWSERFNSHTSAEVITYSIYEDSDFKAVDIKYRQESTSFTLLSPEGEFSAEMKLLGEFNVYNALAAIASLFAKRMPIRKLVDMLKDLKPINGRMEKVNIDSPITMYIDYAHTPDAIEKSIFSVMPFKEKRLIFVAGTGGDQDAYKRPLMAEKASLADYVILTVNDPRNESTSSILADMETGMQHERYLLISDRKVAIKKAIELSEPGDILIIAGKGQEEYQIIGNKKVPHSDANVAIEHCQHKYKQLSP
ncbi:UDP-N-acetylmuramoyl-L-alanyl-D-glutamate--2,6-diaminopimelate ligase [Virgibacillus sp. C22-A2]|uniref:UDP-N-acetylmuramyl-tripeptide synthetase n=1 Tax=Virgibacillus tibetensis TaxID=3042313 RepID=A0ABU6KAJ6_9BACI|nr:UDP-N-acetylmuramoyl-L-alanyl-D-glutamate--2,6-diaminopimelate ligase [Virgibacillus sp. C22-A2]